MEDLQHRICLVAKVPAKVVERLLTTACARSEELAPGSPQNLALLGQEICPPDILLGQTAEMVSHQLGPKYDLFLILDARSTEDDTALLVTRGTSYCNNDKDKDDVETVRIAFSEAQCLITALEMGCLGFEELPDMARSGDGVCGHGAPPQQGGSAPAKCIGGVKDGDE